MLFPNYSAIFDYGLLRKNHNGQQLIRKKHEKSSNIKNNLDYLSVFIDILLVLSKKQC